MSKKNSKTTRKLLKAKKLYSVKINGQFAVTNKKGTKALLKLMRDAGYERYDKETETVSNKLGMDISERPCYSYQNEKERYRGAHSAWMFNDNALCNLGILWKKIPIDTVISNESVYGDFMVNELFGIAQNSDGITEVYDTTVFKFPETTPILAVENCADEFPEMKLGIRIDNHTIVITDRVLQKYTKLTVKTRKQLISFAQNIRSFNGDPTKNPITLLVRTDPYPTNVPLSVTNLNLRYDHIEESEDQNEDETTNELVSDKLESIKPADIEKHVDNADVYGTYGKNTPNVTDVDKQKFSNQAVTDLRKDIPYDSNENHLKESES